MKRTYGEQDTRIEIARCNLARFSAITRMDYVKELRGNKETDVILPRVMWKFHGTAL